MGLRRGALWRIGVIQEDSHRFGFAGSPNEWGFQQTRDLNPAPANIWQSIKNLPVTDANEIRSRKREQLKHKLSRPRPAAKGNYAQHAGR